MQGKAWDAKSLNAALGGWAVISHDTMLYKISTYCVLGLYDDFPGYVEPNPEFYKRLVVLINKTRLELAIEDQGWKQKFHDLMEIVDTLRAISEKEIQGKPFTVTDQVFIEDYGKKIAWFFGYNDNQAQSPDKNCALISDVFTEGYFLQKCLQAGIGLAMTMYVILNVNGDPVLTQGGVFSYYEFEQDMHDRLTDIEWKKMIYEHKEPDFQEWQYAFIPKPAKVKKTDKKTE